MAKKVLPVYAMASLCVAFVQAQPPALTLTVSDLVKEGLEANRDLLAARERLAEAQGISRQAGVRPAPTIQVQAETASPLGTGQEGAYSAGFYYPIETAGKRNKRINVAEFGVALADAEVAERTRQLTFEIKRRAAELNAARRKADAIGRLLDLTRESYKITKARVDQGDAAPLDQQLLAAEQGRVEAQQVSLAGRANAALLELRQIVGAPSIEAFNLREDPVPAENRVPLDMLARRAQTSRADLRAAQLLAAQAGAEMTLQRAQGRADVTASIGYARRSSYFDDQLFLSATGTPLHPKDRDNTVSIGIAVPLFTKRRNLGNVEAAGARERAARLRQQYLASTIPLEVEAAYRRWTAAANALTIFKRGVVDQSEKNLSVIRQAYTLGQLRVLDVLAEQRRLVDTELAYIDAGKEAAQSTAELERAVGGDLQ